MSAAAEEAGEEESRASERREMARTEAGEAEGMVQRAEERMRWRRSALERASSRNAVVWRRTAAGVGAIISPAADHRLPARLGIGVVLL